MRFPAGDEGQSGVRGADHGWSRWSALPVDVCRVGMRLAWSWEWPLVCSSSRNVCDPLHTVSNCVCGHGEGWCSVKLRYNYRLYPDASQREALARLFGCVRAVWNDGLARRKAAWKADRARISGPRLQQMCITAAKRTPERDWLGQVSPVPLQQSLRDLDMAYRNFFASVSGKRKGPKVGLPGFKSRHDHRQSARFTTTAFRLRPGRARGAEAHCIWRRSVRSRCGGRASSPTRRRA